MSVFFNKVIAINSVSKHKGSSLVDSGYVDLNVSNVSVVSENELKTFHNIIFELGNKYALVPLMKFVKFVHDLHLDQESKFYIIKFAQNNFSKEGFSKFLDTKSMSLEDKNSVIQLYEQLYENLKPLQLKENVEEHPYVVLIQDSSSSIASDVSFRMFVSSPHLYQELDISNISASPGSPHHFYEEISHCPSTPVTPVKTSTPAKNLGSSFVFDSSMRDFSFRSQPDGEVAHVQIDSPNFYPFAKQLFNNRMFRKGVEIRADKTAFKAPAQNPFLDIQKLAQELKQDIRKMFVAHDKASKRHKRKDILYSLESNSNRHVIISHLLENNRRLFFGHSKFKKDLKNLLIPPALELVKSRLSETDKMY